jgi:mannonate dehydratase
MKIGLRSHNGAEDRLLFAQQIKAHGASIWASACEGYDERCYLTTEDVRGMRARFDKYDLELTGIGLGGQCVKNQLLGLPGRDQEIENVSRTIRSIGEAYADVSSANGALSPVIIIDQRTTYWAPKGPSWHPGYERQPAGRGGAVLTTFDSNRMVGELDDQPAGQVTNEEVWSRIQYFYERIVPVAEEYKVRLATHPDDPPMACYRGVEQALIGFEGFKKFIDLVPSPYNGLLLCLGCMQEAGEVVPEVIRYFGEREKIFYVHFRNVIGRVPKYIEVFSDDGDGDMVANLKALKAVGYQGYLVPDHHFGVAGDDAEYPLISRAWQVGYIRGLLQTLGD